MFVLWFSMIQVGTTHRRLGWLALAVIAIGFLVPFRVVEERRRGELVEKQVFLVPFWQFDVEGEMAERISYLTVPRPGWKEPIPTARDASKYHSTDEWQLDVTTYCMYGLLSDHHSGIVLSTRQMKYSNPK